MQSQSGFSIRFFANLIAVFAMLSFLDLYLTWRLIDSRGSEVVESNPVAAFVLDHFSWIGLSVFKVSLMLLIGSVAVVVVRRCTRSGELLMVFGCGAQAAIVVTSIFLWRNSEPAEALSPSSNSEAEMSPHSLPSGAGSLLLYRGVREELKLSPEQAEAAEDLVRQRLAMRRSMHSADMTDLQASLQILLAREQAFLKSLSTDQAKRLKQIVLQKRGPLTFAEDCIGKELEFTESQSEDVFRILTALSELETTSRDERTEAELARGKTELLSLLTPAQRTIWARMLGEPFTFEATTVAADAE